MYRRVFYLSSLLILAFALALRLDGVRLGLPYQILIDEPQHLVSALKMLTEGTLDHRNWTYPAFFPTLLAGWFWLTRTASGMGWPPSNADIPVYLLAGRVLVALLGTLTVALTIALARRACGSHMAGLFAGALCALSPLSVRQSQEMVVDAPAALFAVAAVLLAHVALERTDRRWLALSGAAAGLAAATKYNLGLAIVAPLAAALAWQGRERAVRWGLVAVATGAAFLAASPLTIARADKVRERLAYELDHYAGGHMARRTDARAFGAYGRQLLEEVHAIGAGAAAVGAVALARRGLPGAVVLVFPLLYFAFMGRYRVDFARTLTPVVPFLSLAAAAGLHALRRPLTRPGVLALAILALAITLDRARERETRIARAGQDVLAAKDWIEAHVPADAAVALEWHGPPLNEWPSARTFRARVSPFAVTDGLDALRRAGVRHVVESGQFELLRENPDARRPDDPRARILREYDRLRREGRLLHEVGAVKIWEIDKISP